MITIKIMRLIDMKTSYDYDKIEKSNKYYL